MLSLATPAHNSGETYNACITGITDAGKKVKFQTDTTCVEEANRRYALAGLLGNFASLVSGNFQMTSIPASEMKWLYEKRLARSVATREIYGALKQAAPYGRCALCNVRDATTLDHFLPKSLFPSLAVNPLNLLPACGRCNGLKADLLNCAVHSYFDIVSDEKWLRATIVEDHPCAILFHLDCPSKWPQDLQVRAKAHFSTMRLGELFALEASRTLRGNASAFREAFTSDGADGVRASCVERADSWSSFDKNSWEAAMYVAMADSDWFCDGGFELG